MKKLLVAAVVLAVVGIGGRTLVVRTAKQMAEEDARTRVGVVLTGLKKGADGTAYQKAVTMWKANKLGMSSDEFKMAADEFDAFVMRHSIKNLESYEVTSAVQEAAAEGTKPAVVRVAGTTNGRAFETVAVDQKELSWERP